MVNIPTRTLQEYLISIINNSKKKKQYLEELRAYTNMFLEKLGQNPEGLIFIIKLYDRASLVHQQILKEELLSFFKKKSLEERKKFLKVLLSDIDLMFLNIIYLNKDKVFVLLGLISNLLSIKEHLTHNQKLTEWYSVIYNNKNFKALIPILDDYFEETTVKKLQAHTLSVLITLFLTFFCSWVVVNPAFAQPLGIPLPAIPSAGRVPLNVTALYRSQNLNKTTSIFVIKNKKVAAAFQTKINEDIYLNYLESKKTKKEHILSQLVQESQIHLLTTKPLPDHADSWTPRQWFEFLLSLENPSQIADPLKQSFVIIDQDNNVFLPIELANQNSNSTTTFLKNLKSYVKDILSLYKKTQDPAILVKEGEIPPLQKAHLYFNRLAKWFGIKTENDSTSTTMLLDQVLHFTNDRDELWNLKDNDLFTENFLSLLEQKTIEQALGMLEFDHTKKLKVVPDGVTRNLYLAASSLRQLGLARHELALMEKNISFMAPSKLMDTWFVASSIDSLSDLKDKLNEICTDYKSALVPYQVEGSSKVSEQKIKDLNQKLINDVVNTMSETKVLADFAGKGLGFLDVFYKNGNFTTPNQKRLDQYLNTTRLQFNTVLSQIQLALDNILTLEDFAQFKIGNKNYTLAEYVNQERLSDMKYHYSREEMQNMYKVDFASKFATNESEATAISSLDKYSIEKLRPRAVNTVGFGNLMKRAPVDTSNNELSVFELKPQRRTQSDATRKSYAEVLRSDPKPRANTEPTNVQTESRNAWAMVERKIPDSIIKVLQMEGLQRGFANQDNNQNAQPNTKQAVVRSGRLALPAPKTENVSEEKVSPREKATKLKQVRSAKKGTSPLEGESKVLTTAKAKKG